MKSANCQIEERIIRRLRKGESSAFDEIYKLYARNVYRFAYSFLKTKYDSEEVVQEAFLKVWKNRKTIDEFYSLKAYLFTISYHVIIDEFRKRLKDSKYRKFLEYSADLISSETEKAVEFSELYEIYLDAVEKLPEKRKAIFKLNRDEGLSYKEISSLLAISPRTVENQISQALKILHKKLG